MSHIFQRYFDKHGHFPRVVVDSGIQRITVEFCPGYVSIRTSSPYQAQVYVTRSAFLALLRKLLPLARVSAKSPAEDHDVPAAMREAYWLEMQLTQEKRAAKKTQVFDLEAEQQRQRQRRRYLRAQARGQKADE